jgi:hypothetical protein
MAGGYSCGVNEAAGEAQANESGPTHEKLWWLATGGEYGLLAALALLPFAWIVKRVRR